MTDTTARTIAVLDARHSLDNEDAPNAILRCSDDGGRWPCDTRIALDIIAARTETPTLRKALEEIAKSHHLLCPSRHFENYDQCDCATLAARVALAGKDK